MSMSRSCSHVSLVLFLMFSLHTGVCAQSTVSDSSSVTAAGELDAALERHWQTLAISPPELCDDATFARRVWLDLTGHVPPFLAVYDFLKDERSDKRAQLVDRLLASDEFAEHWGRTLTIMLTDRRPNRQETHDGWILQQHLRDKLAAGESYPQIVRALIEGTGVSDSSGPANFLLRYDVQANQLAGAVGKHFLGLTLQCAECHNHPFERWTQDDFRGIAAFFARTKRLDDNNAAEYLRAVVDIRKGELEVDDPTAQPSAEGEPPPKKIIPPHVLGGEEPAEANTRRAALAEWIVSESNPFFAQNTVNRIWSRLFSRGFVEPLDGLGAEDQGPLRSVLDEIADNYVKSGSDLRWLFRTIMLSRTYQATAYPLETTEEPAAKVADASGSAQVAAGEVQESSEQSDTPTVDPRLVFARYPARPLSVDELYASILQATGYSGVDEDEALAMDETAIAYSDRPVEFLGERGLTVQRSLVLLNSEYVQEGARSAARLTAAMQGSKDRTAQLEFMFLAALSRKPLPAEVERLQPLLETAKGSRGLEDVWWIILNSAEFNSNH